MQEPDEILSENAETYRKKNSDYGDSWKLAGMTIALWLQHSGEDEVTLPADEDTWNSLGLFTRRLDKMIRSFNAEFVVDELNYESTTDAHEDESTYAAMHASLIGGQETVEYERAADGGKPEPVFDPEDIADAIDPEVVGDVDPEYEAAYQRLREDR